MKKHLFVTLSLLLFSYFQLSTALAQSPDKMSYQAVIRDAGGQLVTNQAIGMQISILKDGPAGTAVYVETHSAISNVNGLVTIEIGTGTTSDNFLSIDWGNGSYFIKIETDLAGGTNYTITGTSQLLSVPFAFYAKVAGQTENDQILNLRYPDGFTEPQTYIYENNTINEYTVPIGKNFYVQAAQRGFIINTDTINDSYPYQIILGSGDVIKGVTNIGVVAGFLVDSKVETLTLDISNEEYIIPASRTFVLLYVSGKNGSAEFEINDINMNPNGNSNYDFLPLILESGTTLSGNCIINGYFLE